MRSKAAVMEREDGGDGEEVGAEGGLAQLWQQVQHQRLVEQTQPARWCECCGGRVVGHKLATRAGLDPGIELLGVVGALELGIGGT